MLRAQFNGYLFRLVPGIRIKGGSLGLVEGNSVAHDAFAFGEILLIEPGSSHEGIEVRDKIVLKRIAARNSRGCKGFCLKAKRVRLSILRRCTQLCGTCLNDARPRDSVV